MAGSFLVLLFRLSHRFDIESRSTGAHVLLGLKADVFVEKSTKALVEVMVFDEGGSFGRSSGGRS